jgi:ribonuclease HI
MEDKIIVHSDGGARGNPGPAAIGAVMEINGNIFKLSEKIGKATNNVAEYQAIIGGLKKVKQILGKTRAKNARLECFLDSELIVKQLNGQYKIKESGLHKFFIELWNLTLDFKEVEFKHVRREMNKEADLLVNQALDGA